MMIKKISLMILAAMFLSVSQISAAEKNIKFAQEKKADTEYMFNAPVTNGLYTLGEEPELIYTKAAFGLNNDDAKWVAVGVNVIIGFGIGSFIQGDKTYGIIGIIGDAAGYGLLIGAGIAATASAVSLDVTGVGASTALYLVGALVLTASKVLQIIGPFTYATRMAANAFDPSNSKYVFLTPHIHQNLYTNEATVDGANLGMTVKF